MFPFYNLVHLDFAKYDTKGVIPSCDDEVPKVSMTNWMSIVDALGGVILGDIDILFFDSDDCLNFAGTVDSFKDTKRLWSDLVYRVEI